MNPPTARASTLRDRVKRISGVDAARCYQCGKCSGGCPMASETRWRPHDVMRLVARDRAAALFEDESIWLCLTCETCAARCPNGCDPARVIDALRELAAHEAPDRVPTRAGAFHRAFLNQVRAHGRAFELGMVLEYKLRTGALTQDALAAPGMFGRGKLRLTPHRIAGLDEVRRIFAAFADREGETA